MLRYPLGFPDGGIDPIPEGFVEHCDWPLLLRQLIAVICDMTIGALPYESEPCRNALRHLRCTAAANDCLGDYQVGKTIDSEHPWNTLLKHPVGRFSNRSKFVPIYDTVGEIHAMCTIELSLADVDI